MTPSHKTHPDFRDVKIWKNAHPRIKDMQYFSLQHEPDCKTTEADSANIGRKGVCGRNSSQNQRWRSELRTKKGLAAGSTAVLNTLRKRPFGDHTGLCHSPEQVCCAHISASFLPEPKCWARASSCPRLQLPESCLPPSLEFLPFLVDQPRNYKYPPNGCATINKPVLSEIYIAPKVSVI